MKKVLGFIGILCVVAFGSGAGEAAVINVPGTYGPTIQAAVNAASIDDTINVSAGTYTEAVSINKKIYLVGIDTPTITTEGTFEPNTVRFDTVNANGATISGFRITGKNSSNGIYCYNYASPTIFNNIITGNGYGIKCYSYSSPTINNNLITKNNNDGITCEDHSSPSISNNIISMSEYGIFCDYESSPIISNNSIEDITEGDNGGGSGIYCTDKTSSPTINTNTFSRNSNYPIQIYANSVRKVTGNTFLESNRVNVIFVGAALDTIDTNGTWTYQGVPYVIAGNIEVKGVNNPTLTISPRVVLKFFRDTYMYIGGEEPAQRGKLIADGSSGTITFTSNQPTPTPGDWECIYFDNLSDDSSLLKRVVVEYGGYYYNTNIYCDDASPTIQDCIIRKSSVDGIKLVNSSSHIIGSTISDNNRGIRCENNSLPIIASSTISNNRDGIYCISSSPYISTSTIKSNSNHGIFIDSNSAPVIRWNAITANFNGIYSNNKNAVITPNDIYGNTSWGIYNADISGTLTAKNNWWGASSWPLIWSGDRIGPNVDYTPWLYSPIAYGSILGTITNVGLQTGTLYLQACPNIQFTGTPTDEGSFTSQYLLKNLPPNVYYTRAFLDIDNDHVLGVSPESGESQNYYGTPTGITIPLATNIFNIDFYIPFIKEIYHDTVTPLNAGKILKVTLIGKSKGTATFDIGTIIKNIPMTQTTTIGSDTSIYTGTYTVLPGDNIANAVITGHLLFNVGSYSLSATQTVTLDTTPPYFTINVTPPITPEGTVTIAIIPNEPISDNQELLVKDSAGSTLTTSFVSNIAGTITYFVMIPETAADGTATIFVRGWDIATNYGTGNQTFQVSIPRQFSIESDGTLTATVTTTSSSLVVKVKDSLNRSVIGYPITWEVINAPSPANIYLSTTTTGPNGTTSNILTLGTKTGTYEVKVQCATMTQSFFVTAISDIPAIIMIIDGNEQQAIITSTLSSPFIVKVTDKHGNNPTRDTIVNWDIISQPSVATLSATITTIKEGMATTTLTLGTKTGTYIVAAQVADTLLVTTFTTTALPRPLSYIKIKDSQDNEVGNYSMTTDNTLTLYCRGYDADNNLIGYVSGTWTVTDNIGEILSIFGTNTTFDPKNPGIGTITIDDGKKRTDKTGIITVSVGKLNYVRIGDYEKKEVGIRSMTTDDTLTLYCRGYDADNNLIGYVSGTWTVTDNIGKVLTVYGTNTVFDAKKVGVGTVLIDDGADHKNSTDVFTINVGKFTKVKIVDNGWNEIGAVSMTTDKTYNLYSGGFDNDDNCRFEYVSSTWTVTNNIGEVLTVSGTNTIFDAKKVGTGTIKIEDAERTDETGIITINVGELNYVRIEDVGREEIGTYSMTTDDTLTLYCRGYDADNNLIGDVKGTWTVTNNIGEALTVSGTSTTLDAKKTGTGTIKVEDNAGHTDKTGIITVNVGAVNYVRIEDAFGNEIKTHSMTTDNTLILYCRGYDADNNLIGYVTGTWTVTNNIGKVLTVFGTWTTLDAKKTGAGTIKVEDNAGHTDETGIITISLGVVNYVKIEDIAGNEIKIYSMTTDDTLTLYCRGYDADDNLIGYIDGTWTVTNNIGKVLTIVGASTIFDAKKVGAGSIEVLDAANHKDSTGVLTINVGEFAKVKIVDGQWNKIGTVSMTTEDNYKFYSGGFDKDDNCRFEYIMSNWTVTNDIGEVLTVFGTSTIFDAKKVGIGTIKIEDGFGHTDEIGVITINVGEVSYVKIEDILGNEIGNHSMTTDDTLTLYCRGYDADNNLIGYVSGTWTVTGNIGEILSVFGTNTTFDPKNPGTETITINDGKQHIDKTGSIIVNLGAISRLGFIQPSPLTVGMTGIITIQTLDMDGNVRPATMTTTIIVSGDDHSRFATTYSDVIWDAKGTFTIAPAMDKVSFFFKQNGTTTSLIITAGILGTNVANTYSVTILPLVDSSSGIVLGDDGKTKILVGTDRVIGIGYIEIKIAPETTTEIEAANDKDNLNLKINRVQGTMRQITAKGVSIGTVTIVIPYPDEDNDGYVDGITNPKIREVSLEVYRLVGSGTNAVWIAIPNSRVDTQNNTVSVDVSAFSHFILMGAGYEPNLDKAVIYPNPYYANKHEWIYFDKLTKGSTIKIFTIVGELVREIQVQDLPQKWDVRNEAGEGVTSGIYLYIIKDPAGNKKTGKLAVIR